MKNQTPRRVGGGRWFRAATCVALTGLTGLTGCTYVMRDTVDTQLFRQNLMASAQAVQRGDLEEAEVHLATARPLANTPHAQQQLRSMEMLIQGAEQMMVGDQRLAAATWSRIEDPHLRREVRHTARRFDVDVPLSPSME